MKKLFAVVLLALFMTQTQAKLLISPTRVAFGANERAKEVILINTSTKSVTYRMEWKDMHALPAGGYKELEEGEALPVNSASELIRFSPRQVTLQPGERQIIKLLARRRPSFDLPEYRSHLNFIAIPSALSEENVNSGSMTVRLDVFMSYSIPVLVKSAEIDSAVAISAAHLTPDVEKNRYNLSIEIKRTGQQSFFGKIRVYEMSGGDKELVGQLNGINLFTPINKFTRNIKLTDYALDSANPLLVEMYGDDENSTASKTTFQILR